MQVQAESGLHSLGRLNCLVLVQVQVHVASGLERFFRRIQQGFTPDLDTTVSSMLFPTSN